jgi:hypothetical protein
MAEPAGRVRPSRPTAAARLRFVLLLAPALGVVAPRTAHGDEPFVDRPLTLPPLHFSADAGIGFGQGPRAPAPLPPGASFDTGTKLGWGSNLEAAVGLPFLGELGVRVGLRFGDDGINAGSPDHFARLFDPIVDEPGRSSVTNPELRLRGTLLDLHVVELGLETRAIIPTDSGSDFELIPGAPVRIHLPTFARIDTGVWLPVEFDSDIGFRIEIPAQLFFQAGQAFFGPVTGIRFNHPGGDIPSTAEIPAGVAAGYTLGGILDLKVQVRTERINDTAWSQYIGGGIGAGLRLP